MGWFVIKIDIQTVKFAIPNVFSSPTNKKMNIYYTNNC